jgi:hypothetical protein
MNERIRELAEQAGITTNIDTDYYEKDMNKWVDYFSEKFAELIVKECIETVAENMYSGSTPSDFSDGADFAYAQAISDIKQHFGVEE